MCIDVQNYGLKPAEDPAERARWAPFLHRMGETVIPNLRALQGRFRANGLDVLHARIACLLADGRDRSLSQRLPGWNDLLMPLTSEASQIVSELAPAPGEVCVTKTTDSALTGTNLRLVLHNMGIRHVVVVEDCCAAATDGLHEQELAILNRIYCHVVTSAELCAMMGLG